MRVLLSLEVEMHAVTLLSMLVSIILFICDSMCMYLVTWIYLFGSLPKGCLVSDRT